MGALVLAKMASTIVQNVLDRAAEDAEKISSIQVDKPIDLEYDMKDIIGCDINAIDINQLRTEEKLTLTALARDDVQLIVNRMFQLPTVRVDNLTFVSFPAGSTRLPRAKPVPKAKQLTKWEKYAKEKGITKRKKDKLEWDEELNKWVPRYGFKKSQAEKEKSWVVELPGNAKDTDDPIAQRKTKKEEAVAKNELQRLRNLSARTLKSKAKSRINLEPTERPTAEQLNRSVYIAHTATASVGKFQANLPEQKPVLKSGQKRQFNPLVGDVKQETARNLEIFEKLSSKKPKLDIEKAVNREISQTGPTELKHRGSEKKKSKTSLKKSIGKRNHKGGKGMAVNKSGGKGKGKKRS